jgi:hypothetical protein
MAKDFMRYDRMAQDALRGVVRMALERASTEGLPGGHHFFITFFTEYEGVEVSEALHERYPVDMTVVVQHQYWDLEVADDHFSICLSFNKVPERLVVPYKSIRAFIDPSVQFGLEFQVEGFSAEPRPRLVPADGDGDETGDETEDKASDGSQDGDGAQITALQPRANTEPAVLDDDVEADDETETEQDDKETPEKTGDVVSLDAFRKK